MSTEGDKMDKEGEMFERGWQLTKWLHEVKQQKVEIMGMDPRWHGTLNKNTSIFVITLHPIHPVHMLALSLFIFEC